jgi:hypothetical protein
MDIFLPMEEHTITAFKGMLARDEIFQLMLEIS